MGAQRQHGLYGQHHSRLQGQGRAEGRLEGEQSGEAKALRRLLQKRFGPLSDDVLARLQSASIDELELWLDRALDADSLAGVFAQ